MTKPIISIGIPFFNAENDLLSSVRSIFAQTYKDWELILVDDGSTDNSLAIARSIDDPRVRVLEPDGRNRKLAFRLNQIAQVARGEYLARMDADDLCHPDRLARQLDFLMSNPDVDVVGASSCILDKEGCPAKKCSVAQRNEDIFGSKFKSGVSVVHPSLMAKTDWWLRWPYDENNIRNEDYELWLRSCKDSVFGNLPDLFYFTNEFVSYSIRKYAKSKITAAGVIWRYASKEIGKLKAGYYAGKRYINIVVYAGALALGMHEKLISRRYSSLTSQESDEVTAAIDLINNINVPIRKS